MENTMNATKSNERRAVVWSKEGRDGKLRYRISLKAGSKDVHQFSIEGVNNLEFHISRWVNEGKYLIGKRTAGRAGNKG
jgi:hypothetical protein